MCIRSCRNRGFTLIELLVVIAIIALLSSVVFAVLSAARAKARDARRLADLYQLARAIKIYESGENSPNFGNSKIVYISLPDSSPNCGSWTAQLPALHAGWAYACVSASTLRNVDGTGWVPVNLAGAAHDASFISYLPVDPLNNALSYYAYIPQQDGVDFALGASKAEVPVTSSMALNSLGGFTVGPFRSFSVATGATSSAPDSVTPSSLTNGIVVFYPLMADSREAISGIKGIDTNITYTATGAYFDGSTSNISLGSTSWSTIGTGDFTASFMIKATAWNDARWHTVYCQMLSGSSNGVCFDENGSSQNIYGNSLATYSQEGVTVNTEQMWTLVRRSGVSNWYLNGNSENVWSSSYGNINTSDASYFGWNPAYTSVGYYKGTMRNFGFWKRALTDAEIKTLYNSGSGLSYPFAQ